MLSEIAKDKEETLKSLEVKLESIIGKPLLVTMLKQVGEGKLNKAYQIKSDDGYFFLKCRNNNAKFDIFQTEAKGLETLLRVKALKVPEVYGQFEWQANKCLLLEHIDSGTQHYDFWRDLGIGLAYLHKNKNKKFGLSYNNYISGLLQNNSQKDNFIDFFVENRLEPQLKTLIDAKKVEKTFIKQFSKLYSRLSELIPTEAPALLHGDFWSGNVMSDINGDPVIFDPAIYYGHREADIAMSLLFGGFDDAFYGGYNEIYPLEKNYKQRANIFNLYPLLVHSNVFGGSYLQSVRNIVGRF